MSRENEFVQRLLLALRDTTDNHVIPDPLYRKTYLGYLNIAIDILTAPTPDKVQESQ